MTAKPAASAAAIPGSAGRPRSYNWKGERGRYGEILPPLFVEGYSADQALDAVLEANAALGGQSKKRTRGAALEAQIVTGMVYVHQKSIRDIVAGKTKTPVERAFFEAVTLGGHAFSLRPPSVETLTFKTFAPVIQTMTPGEPAKGNKMTWRVGMEGKGRTELIVSDDPAKVMAKAQQLYFEWCEVDDAEFDTIVEKALARHQPSLYHTYFLGRLEETDSYDFGGGFKLTLLGRHNTLLLDTPIGPRILQTDRPRAVRIADALCRESRMTPAAPDALTLVRWFQEQGTVSPDKVTWSNAAIGLPATMVVKGVEYALVKREQMIVVYPVFAGGKFGEKAGETTLEPAVAEWLGKADPQGRQAIALWAMYSAGVRQAARQM